MLPKVVGDDAFKDPCGGGGGGGHTEVPGYPDALDQPLKSLSRVPHLSGLPVLLRSMVEADLLQPTMELCRAFTPLSRHDPGDYLKKGETSVRPNYFLYGLFVTTI